MIQLCILKIMGYGPWTLTLGSDREHRLQMLQASLYRNIQKLFSDRDCLVFSNRSDEFFAVTNGLTLGDHIAIQKALQESFEVSLSVSVGYGRTPLDANLKAHRGKKDGIALDKQHDIFGFISKDSLEVSIMHLDVDGLSSRHEKDSPYEISNLLFRLYSKMSDYFIQRNSLTFFMGGDNFMVVASDAAKKDAQDFINQIKTDDIGLNCGIGTARTARNAARLATKSLDAIREIRDSGGPKPDVYESC